MKLLWNSCVKWSDPFWWSGCCSSTADLLLLSVRLCCSLMCLHLSEPHLSWISQGSQPSQSPIPSGWSRLVCSWKPGEEPRPVGGCVIRPYRGDNGDVAACRNRGERRMNAFECVRRVYHMDGLRGFYRGMSASYAGISETVIHFVIYESIKRKLLEFKANSSMDEDEESVKNASDFVGMMLAAATSKTCATSIAYPHGNRLPLRIVSFWATAMKMNKKWLQEWVHILY